jgi:dTDP-4-amino-4,6-dideoxygalactose transaminase
MIDLRSDTVTKPDKDILQEAIVAELGDDEYGEDPTVNQLQEKCSELLGFEDALFVSSGLMGNQISLLIQHLILILKITSTVLLLFFLVFSLEKWNMRMALLI